MFVEWFDQRLRVFRAQVVHGHTVGDPITPGGEAHRIAQRREPTQDAQPDVLNRLARYFITWKQRANISPEPLVPGGNQLIKRLYFSQLAAHDEQCLAGVVRIVQIVPPPVESG